MPRRNDIAKILIIGAEFMVFFGVFRIELGALQRRDKSAANPTFISQCAPDMEQAHERVFANPGAKTWKEYANVDEVGQLDGDNDETIFVLKTNSSGSDFMRLIEDGEDRSTLEESCYARSGALRSMHYEMRTPWGWGYEDERLFNAAGKTLRHSARFFDTATHKNLPRPRLANDVPNLLMPRIYHSFDALPFIATLKKPRVNAP
jgi:hypothetical protein